MYGSKTNAYDSKIILVFTQAFDSFIKYFVINSSFYRFRRKTKNLEINNKLNLGFL